MIKNRLIAATMAAAAIAVPTGTVGAGGPERFTDQLTVEELNPCTGEVGDVEVARRVNMNNTVLTIRTSSVGEDGWTGSGSDTLVISERGAHRGREPADRQPRRGRVLRGQAHLQVRWRRDARASPRHRRVPAVTSR